MAKKLYLPSFLLGANNLLVTRDQYNDALINFALEGEPSLKQISMQSYQQITDAYFNKFNSLADPDIPITRDYSSRDIEHNSIAYFPIFGFITADSRWLFSSKNFESQIKDADSNPNISVHFIHVNSGGGEAWYLDRLSETLSSLNKPIYALIEKTCGSAAYYIACHGSKLMALTQNDVIGCIGVMIKEIDTSKYFEDLGIKIINLYADQSDLKNKKYEDAVKGKPEQFIKDELNPLAQQFIDEVKRSRKPLRNLKDDDPILRGETYIATMAKDNGLIDGITTFEEAIKEAYQMGINAQSKQRVYSIINN